DYDQLWIDGGNGNRFHAPAGELPVINESGRDRHRPDRAPVLHCVLRFDPGSWPRLPCTKPSIRRYRIERILSLEYLPFLMRFTHVVVFRSVFPDRGKNRKWGLRAPVDKKRPNSKGYK